jgi:UDP-N-acetylmuramoylalanine--D-glutamate ligase
MAAYAAAKARVFGSTHGLMVLNREDPAGDGHAAASTAASPEAKPCAASQRSPRRCAFLVATCHSAPGDFGIEHVNGMAWLVRALEADETIKRSARKGQASRSPVHIQRLIPADALRIRGRHNAVNALAALALASATGLCAGAHAVSACVTTAASRTAWSRSRWSMTWNTLTTARAPMSAPPWRR